MKAKIFLLCVGISFFAQTQLSAQNARNMLTGQATGAAGAWSCLKDAYAVWNNPAGMAGQKELQAAFGYDNRFGLKLFHTFGAGISAPLPMGNIGLSVQRFGDEAYNEHQLGLGYAHQISNVLLGLKFNIVQIHMKDIGVRRAAVLEFGGITSLSEQFDLGVHVYNFTRTRLYEFQDERLPTMLRIGLAYKPIDKLRLYVDGEKDIDFKGTFRFGMTYQVKDFLFASVGANTYPAQKHFGLGINVSKLRIDYSFYTHPVLPLSQQIGLVYQLKNKQTEGEKTNR